jgi:hypothetical protein
VHWSDIVVDHRCILFVLEQRILCTNSDDNSNIVDDDQSTVVNSNIVDDDQSTVVNQFASYYHTSAHCSNATTPYICRHQC